MKSILSILHPTTIAVAALSASTAFAGDFEQIGYVTRGMYEIQKINERHQREFRDFAASLMAQRASNNDAIAQRMDAGQVVAGINRLLNADMSPANRMAFSARMRELTNRGSDFPSIAKLMQNDASRLMASGNADDQRGSLVCLLSAAVACGNSVDQISSMLEQFVEVADNVSLGWHRTGQFGAFINRQYPI